MKLALYFMGPALCVQVSMPFNLKHTWCFVLHCVLCVTPDPDLVPHGQHKDEQQALFGIIKLTGLRTQGGACPLLGTGPYVQGLYLEKKWINKCVYIGLHTSGTPVYRYFRHAYQILSNNYTLI